MELVLPDGTSIAWHTAGREGGAAVLMLHSLGLDSSMWQPQVDALAGDFQVITFDARGHGDSSAPPGPYTMSRLALDGLAVADAAGLARFHVCGLSIGGQMAQWLAIHHPDRVASLVLADTAARIGTSTSWHQRIAAVRAGGMAAVRAHVLAVWFSEGFERTSPSLYASAAARLLSTSVDGYAGACAALAASDLRNDSRSIVAPTLIIAGADDVPTPPSEARWLHDRIPGSELAIINHAAHISNLDAADEFNDLLAAFLNRQVAADSGRS